MKILIIGTGHVGSALADRFTGLGHDITSVNTSTPVADVVAAAQEADVVVLAVHFRSFPGIDGAVKEALNGKIVIDTIVPLAPDFMSLTVGHSTSAAEEVAAALPGARVVAAFSTVFAGTLKTGTVGGQTLFLPVAGDDEEAKKTVLSLGAELGFDAVDAGPLLNARYMEPFIELLIQLAYGQGHGDGIGLVLARP